MKVKVVVQEINIIERTYEIDGVNSLETAEKCAHRCGGKKFQPNATCLREVPQPPYYKTVSYEIVEC